MDPGLFKIQMQTNDEPKWWAKGKGFLFQSCFNCIEAGTQRWFKMNSEQIYENICDMFQMLINFLVLKANVSFVKSKILIILFCKEH